MRGICWFIGHKWRDYPGWQGESLLCARCRLYGGELWHGDNPSRWVLTFWSRG